MGLCAGGNTKERGGIKVNKWFVLVCLVLIVVLATACFCQVEKTSFAQMTTDMMGSQQMLQTTTYGIGLK